MNRVTAVKVTANVVDSPTPYGDGLADGGVIIRRESTREESADFFSR